MWVSLKPFLLPVTTIQVATACCRPPKLFWMSGYSEAKELLLCLDNPYQYQRKELHEGRVHYCRSLLPKFRTIENQYQISGIVGGIVYSQIKLWIQDS